jgi:hypothetical protein
VSVGEFAQPDLRVRRQEKYGRVVPAQISFERFERTRIVRKSIFAFGRFLCGLQGLCGHVRGLAADQFALRRFLSRGNRRCGHYPDGRKRNAAKRAGAGNYLWHRRLHPDLRVLLDART